MKVTKNVSFECCVLLVLPCLPSYIHNILIYVLLRPVTFRCMWDFSFSASLKTKVGINSCFILNYPES